MSTARRAALVQELRAHARGVTVRLTSGAPVRIAFADFDFLRRATPAERQIIQVEDEGMAIWWPALDEGISLAGLLGVSEADMEAVAFRRTSSRATARR
jgi:hypothetical protein